MIGLLLGLLLAPLLPGLIARVKAFMGGREGAPAVQPYFELARLVGKGAVYSRTTTSVFRLAPSVALAATIGALALVPLGSAPALASFPGDFLLLAGLLAVARFALVLAALDTGSSFEAMGASREVWIGALAETGFLVSLAAAARIGHGLSLSDLAMPRDPAAWTASLPVLGLLAVALTLLALAECARIPVDDPTTHLELTMIHEVMILDHSGPDLAALLYASHLKMWILGSLVLAVIGLDGWFLVSLGLLVVWAWGIGLVESSAARLSLARIPQFLAVALALAVVAFLMGS